MTERARRRRALARAPARVRTGARRVCSAHLVMRSPRTRVAPALTRALPPSRNRVFTGRHLRLYRQDRDRAHRARQAPHPDPGCQPQGAPPPTSNEAQNRKTAPACAFEPTCAPRDRAIARATRGAGAKRARDAREEHVPRSRAHTCPSRSAPPPPPPASATAGAATRRFGCAPAKRRRRRLSVSAARERRFRASHLAVARQIFGDLSCERASLEKGVFARFRKKFFH